MSTELCIHDECQWCGTGRLVVPDDDRCRCCIEDGILPAVEPLQVGHPAVDHQLRVMTEDARKQRIHDHRERNNPFRQVLTAAWNRSHV